MTMYDQIRNGHWVKDTGRVDRTSAGIQKVWTCIDCGDTGTFSLLRGGNTGCPARPNSLGRLSVCPGGERCRTHPDTTTDQWRAWKESKSMPIDSVPHYRCTVDSLAERAAAQYLTHANKIGMKMSVWSAQAFTVGPEGGAVAEFTHASGPWHVVVSPYGDIAAHPGSAPA